MKFGLMFFSSAQPEASREGSEDRYRLLREAARFGDHHGFCALWTPERHFHPFGGPFPNPALTSAALATVTERIELRAGSLIAPLHDTLRIAEEWSVVDNLSGGRVAVSFGSGWNADDFVFFPHRYDDRRTVVLEQVDEVQHLWRGGKVTRTNGRGREVEVGIFPRPVQERLPVWLTSSGNPQTFADAGTAGANLLTHLIGQDLGSLAEKIAVYRQARGEAGLEPAAGIVTLMLHTFLGADADQVHARVRKPFREYLRSAVSLERMAAESGGAISGGHEIEAHEISEQALEELLDLTVDRYSRDASLLGTPEGCRELVWRLEEAGIGEIACLIDFVDDADAVLEALPHLDRLRALCDTDGSVGGFLDDLEGDLQGELEGVAELEEVPS